MKEDAEKDLEDVVEKQKDVQNVIKEEIKHPEVKSDKVIRARLEENKRRREAGRAIGEEIRSLAQIERGMKLTQLKAISQAEFNYYNDVNQSCATRLAIVNLAEKLKKPEKKGRKKVSDDDDSEEKEVIEIKDNDEMEEDNDGSYESRRKIKHMKKKRKQKSVMK
jgi:hypothetical protein